MAHRATRRRHHPWERIKIHPRADREKITALKADMMRAFVTRDLDTYWRLDHEFEMGAPAGQEASKRTLTRFRARELVEGKNERDVITLT